mgnify:FL=1
MATKKSYPRIQSKIVKKWKEKYRLNGIEISYNRFGTPTWEMRSTNSRFISYQGAVPIKDITDLDNNVELFKREYPALLKAELDAMIQAYPEDRRFKEDLRMFLRLFGRK